MKRNPTPNQLAYWQRMRDTDGFRKMASKGGAVNAVRRGPAGMSELGKLGGPANVAKHGREKMSENGRKGGRAVLAKYGPDHFRHLVNMREAKRKEQKHDRTTT
jgi:general stress protein YciG